MEIKYIIFHIIARIVVKYDKLDIMLYPGNIEWIDYNWCLQ